MAEEKPKNDEKIKNDEQSKTYRTEWSFSFNDLADQINDFVRGIGVNDPEAVKTEWFSEPVGAATAARVRLDIPVAETVVNSAVGGDNLIDAEITHIGEIKFAVSGDDRKVVNVSQQADAADWAKNVFGWIGSKGSLRWNVGLTSRIPLDLDVHSGAGKTTLDLSKLQLAVLDVSGGAGQLDISLPVTSDKYTAHISGGVGEVEVRVPAGASVELQINSGTGKVTLEVGDGADVTARLKGGVGECNVLIPSGAPIRVQADVGMGDVSVPSSFMRMSGSDHGVGRSGTWQSQGYENAARKIDVRYEGGLGSFRVR